MKVTGFDDVLRFRDFFLIKTNGSHCKCKFSFVQKNSAEQFEKKGDVAKIIDGDQCLMVGTVTKVEYTKGKSADIITVTIHSNSLKSDLEKKNRIFQKENQTYQDIINEIANQNNIEIIYSKDLKEKKLFGAVIQKNETDFMFLKKLSLEAYEESLIPDCANSKKNRMFIGSRSDENRILKSEEVYSMTIIQDCDSEQIIFSILGDSLGQELRQYVDIGKNVVFKHKTYTICKIEIRLENGVYRYHCIAEMKCEVSEQSLTICEGILFEAKVVENEDPECLGRVRLDFSKENIEDMTSEDKIWIDVLTPYTAKTGGFVFIPEKEDDVETIWNGKEFFVVGCRRKQSLEGKYQNISLKQIGNLFEKNICFSEDFLEISSKDSKVIISDEEIEVTVPNSKLQILEDAVTLETDGSKCIMDNNTTLSTAKVHVDSDIVENNIKKSYQCECKKIGLNASSTMKIEGKMGVSIN